MLGIAVDAAGAVGCGLYAAASLGLKHRTRPQIIWRARSDSVVDMYWSAWCSIKGALLTASSFARDWHELANLRVVKPRGFQGLVELDDPRTKATRLWCSKSGDQVCEVLSQCRMRKMQNQSDFFRCPGQ
jgi:hypothetical protein